MGSSRLGVRLGWTQRLPRLSRCPPMLCLGPCPSRLEISSSRPYSLTVVAFALVVSCRCRVPLNTLVSRPTAKLTFFCSSRALLLNA